MSGYGTITFDLEEIIGADESAARGYLKCVPSTTYLPDESGKANTIREVIFPLSRGPISEQLFAGIVWTTTFHRVGADIAPVTFELEEGETLNLATITAPVSESLEVTVLANANMKADKSALDAEAAARAAADAALDVAIDAEALARAEADAGKADLVTGKVPQAQLPAHLDPTALNGAYGVGATLSRWFRAFGTDPSTAKIAIVGDSTAEETNYPRTYQRLRNYHMQAGQLLGGMTSGNLIEGGNSGLSLENWLTGLYGDYKPVDLWAANANLIVYRWGTNDMRLGLRTQAQMIGYLQQLVDMTRENEPNADIILAVPPTFTTTVVGTDYLGGATLAQAQARSTALRNAHLAMKDYKPNVYVWDAAAEHFGTVVTPTSPLMADQLHQSLRGQERWADLFAALIGTKRERVESIAPSAYRWQVQGYVTAAGNGFIDIDALDDTFAKGKEWPLTVADILYIPGFASSPLTLTSATFPASGNNVRILKAGTDFTSVAVNTLVTLVGAHGAEGVSEGRVQVTVDPGSIAAGGELDVTVTVTGATTDCGVIVQPPTAAMVTGLSYIAWVSAANTVTLRLRNATGSAIDPASATWKFWLAR